MARVRRSVRHQDPQVIADSIDQWNALMGILDRQLRSTGSHVTGSAFTLADIVLALSTQRWLNAPIERPALSAVAAWYERLHAREPFGRCCNADMG